MEKSYTRHILIAGFISVFLILLSLSFFWYINTSHIKQRLEDLKDRFEIAKLIHTMSDSTRMRSISAHRMLLTNDVFERFDEQDNFYSYAQKFINARNSLLNHPAFDERDKLAWDGVKDIVSAGGSLHTEIVDNLMDLNDQQAIVLLKNDSKNIQDNFIKKFNAILSEKNDDVDHIVQDAKNINDRYLRLIVLVGTISLFFLSVMFIYAYRYIARSEETLQKAHELEKAENRYKTEFLARASHELRTPLNSILGFAQVINMDENNRLPKEHAVYFKHIEKSGWQLLSLINDILDITRIQEGSISFEIETFSLNDVVLRCFDSLSGMAKKYNVKCSLLSETNYSNTIKSDRNRINQILQNLISNAIKYNIEGGKVSVTINDAADNMVQIDVCNTGTGIEKQDLDKLFKPFSRIGNISEEDGRGIGLVLTKSLVKCLDGQIGVESTPGVTTQFWVLLPKSYSHTSRMMCQNKKSGLLGT